MALDNDNEFKAALDGLAGTKLRLAAALFAENVQNLSGDMRVKSAISAAKRADISADELEMAAKSARKASLDSYTQCGKECDWNSQAGHFVAEAAVACLKPAAAGFNPAWDAAMQARMARTCASIASGAGTDNTETVAQYRILSQFMNA